MRANNGSTMFITQTMSEAEALCDRIAIMVNGGLCCITETEKLKKLIGGYNLKIILKGHMDASSYQNLLAKEEAKKDQSKEEENLDLKEADENTQLSGRIRSNKENSESVLDSNAEQENTNTLFGKNINFNFFRR